MKVLLLIYHDYEVDEVNKKSKKLMGDDEDIRVYHFHEEDAVEFFEQKDNIEEVFFTKTISFKHKNLFSNAPYNGTQMS